MQQFSFPISAVGPNQSITPAFKTTRTGIEKVSAPVIMRACHYDKSTREIRVFCSDGLLRSCKIDRLIDADAASRLWKRIKADGASEAKVVFRAAGGFSADKWFYDYEVI